MNISKLIEQLASMRERHGDVEIRLMHGHDMLAYESEVRGICCSKYLSDKTDLKLEGLRQNSLNPELPPSTRSLEGEQYYQLMRQRKEGPAIVYIVEGTFLGEGNTGAWDCSEGEVVMAQNTG